MAYTAGNPTNIVTPAALMGAATGADHQMLEIHLEYNDLLVAKGVASAHTYAKRASILHGLARYEDAIDAADLCLEADPSHVEGRYLRGVCIQLLALELCNGVFPDHIEEDIRSMLHEAATCFENVLVANPHDVEAGQHLTNLRFLCYDPSS